MKTLFTFSIKNFTIQTDDLGRYYFVDKKSEINDPIPLNVGNLPDAKGESQQIIIDYFFGNLNKIRDLIMSLNTYSPLRNRYRNFRKHLNNMISDYELMGENEYVELHKIIKQSDDIFKI